MKRRRAAAIVALATIMILASVSMVFATPKKYSLPTSVRSTTVYYGYKTDCSGQKYSYVANTITWNFKYKYSKYGHVVSEDNGYGKTVYNWKYKKKKPVSVTTGSKNNSMFFKKTYGKKGRLKSKTEYWYDNSGKGMVTGESKYAYNKKGWIKKCTRVDSSGNVFISNYTYKFHRNGFPKTITYTSKYGKKTIEVNDKGLITNNGTKYEYTYDKKGRPVMCVIKTMNSGRVYSEDRLYFYYSKAKTTDKKAYFAAMNNILYNADSYIDDATVNMY